MENIRRLAITAMLSVLLAACQQPPAAAPSTGRDLIGRETVSYRGDIPCADCPGQQLTVTLFPDFTYRLRRIYREADGGRDAAFHETGRWARAQDDGANRLRLAGSNDTPQYLRIVGTDMLRLLDIHGRDIGSPHNHDLKRLPQPDPVIGPMPLRGLYRYMADAASFQECRSGKRYPVQMIRDHAALERAYLAARTAPGATMLALIEGRFVQQAPEPGMAARDHIVVERHLTLRPGETCAAGAPARATLANTYWRPVELGGKPVTIRGGVREPHLILDEKESRARGFSGCNGFGGGYRLEGPKLAFANIVSTMMACLPAGDLEQRFFTALKNTAAHAISGDVLELRDAGGGLLGRFEARYLR
ncbi:MAG: META domain-containing protein [Burkholderiales bacterium]|nr:META domain-containing protein [Burkholderiales bacterium]